jgi:hypothetical protein
MTTNEYLQELLKSQDLGDDSRELKDLIDRRKHVEGLLRSAFPDSAPTIRYGGSRAKGTLIKELYDLDIVCYFPNDDTTAGESLKDIYDNAAKALEKEYSVVRKTSALRLRSREAVDFHIDVVPGRFTDQTKGDCFLYQESAEKCRLKTNLDTHIAHVRDSGVLDALRLLKLWKARKGLQVKQFVFELMVIKVLKDAKKKSVSDQLTLVWTQLRDLEQPVSVEDPANPTGNDLTTLLSGSTWSQLQTAATSTLSVVEANGWEAVFGKVESQAASTQDFHRAAAVVSRPSKPWCP